MTWRRGASQLVQFVVRACGERMVSLDQTFDYTGKRSIRGSHLARPTAKRQLGTDRLIRRKVSAATQGMGTSGTWPPARSSFGGASATQKATLHVRQDAPAAQNAAQHPAAPERTEVQIYLYVLRDCASVRSDALGCTLVHERKVTPMGSELIANRSGNRGFWKTGGAESGAL
jgi:hypothetical protein